MTDQSLKTGSAENAPSGPSWLTAEPDDERKVVTRSFRLSAQEGARIDGAARALGMTTSAYVRSRVFSPGPDLAAWRAVYERLARLATECDGTTAADRVHAFKEDFERIVLTVPAPGDGQA